MAGKISRWTKKGVLLCSIVDEDPFILVLFVFIIRKHSP